MIHSYVKLILGLKVLQNTYGPRSSYAYLLFRERNKFRNKEKT